MARVSSIRKIYSISVNYFVESLRTFSTWILIAFNLFLLISFYVGNVLIIDVIMSYLVQATILVILFGVCLLSLRKFISVNKKISGKGIIWGTSIFTIFLWIFYGIALYLLFVPMIGQFKISLSFFIAILILLFQTLLFFVLNFKKERQRLERIDLVKSFFEPAGNILPIYVAILFMMVIGQASIIIIIIKTIADIIINSPLNIEEPYVYKVLSETKGKRLN